MKIITISGVDGSGKSTQINLLKTYLESQDKKVFYFHAVQNGIAKKIVDFRNKYCLLCRLMGKCKTSYKEKSVTHANSWQICLRKLFLRIDIWRFKRLYKKLEKQGYDYILSDRYFYDSIVNIEYLSILTSNVRKFLTFDVRKPDLAIYLYTDPKIIMSRKRKPDQGLEYLKKKKELYDTKISKWDWKAIDGNQDKNVIFEEIKSFLK